MFEAYGLILRLYPARHRALFESEMMATFRQAADESRQRGVAASLRFSCREIAGLTQGLVSEWLASWATGDSYLEMRPTEQPMDIPALQSRIQKLIRHMEYAIAQHDFPRARFYSDEERTARVQLERLIGI